MKRKMKKDKVSKCGCRKRNKKCTNPNPCKECKKQNELIEGIKCVKRGRGRPRKIKLEEKVKNPCTESKGIIGKRGRGRPKKVKVEESIVIVPTFTYKFLGYCPFCKLSIADRDIEKGSDKVTCQKCGKLLKLNELTKTIDLDRPKTKKEYFQSVNSAYTWHDYSASTHINSIAKKEDPMLDEIEDEHIKSDEDDIISNVSEKFSE